MWGQHKFISFEIKLSEYQRRAGPCTIYLTYEIQNKITTRLYIFKGCEIVLVVSMCTRTQPPSPVDQQPLVPEAGAQPVPKNGAIVITACHSSIFLLTGILILNPRL